MPLTTPPSAEIVVAIRPTTAWSGTVWRRIVIEYDDVVAAEGVGEFIGPFLGSGETAGRRVITATRRRLLQPLRAVEPSPPRRLLPASTHPQPCVSAVVRGAVLVELLLLAAEEAAGEEGGDDEHRLEEQAYEPLAVGVEP